MTETTNKPHPYHEVLQWVAEGKAIEALHGTTWYGTTANTVFHAAQNFGSNVHFQPTDFRLKPESKPDIVGYCEVDLDRDSISVSYATKVATKFDTLKITFCGETRKLKSVEII